MAKAKAAKKKSAPAKTKAKGAAPKKAKAASAASSESPKKREAWSAPSSPAKFSKSEAVRSQGNFIDEIVAYTGLSKKQVKLVLATAGELIAFDLTKGSGVSKFAGLMKISLVKKPATKARKGVNPFNGEQMTFKAKPARNVVKIRPLKALKDKV